MPHHRLTLGRAVLVAGLLGLALAGCGRKGPLEAPPNATNAIELPDSQIGGVAAEGSFAGTSPLAKPAKSSPAVSVPNRRFVLDPLL